MYTILSMKQIITALLALLLGGCSFVNDCGVSTHYYNDCKEYYDSMGIYHRECPKNNVYNRCEEKGGDSVIKDCINCN